MMTTHKTRVLWVLVLATLAAIAMLAGLRPAEAAFPGVNGKIVFSSDRTIREYARDVWHLEEAETEMTNARTRRDNRK